MTIVNEIINMQNKIGNAYNMIDIRGGNLPYKQDLYNMPSAINTIPGPLPTTPLNITPSVYSQNITPSSVYSGFNIVYINPVDYTIDSNITAQNIINGCNILGIVGNYNGIIPEGTLNINKNGGKNVTNYAFVNVNVEDSRPSKYGATVDTFFGNISENGYYPVYDKVYDINLSNVINITMPNAFAFTFAFTTPVNTFTTDASNLSYYCFSNAFNGSRTITSANFYNIINLTINSEFASAFKNSSLQEINFDNLTTITAYTFQNAFSNTLNLQYINFPKLRKTDIGAFTFAFANSNANEVSFPNLHQIGQSAYSQAFFNAKNLRSVNFCNADSILNSTFYNSFYNCSNLINVNFCSINTLNGASEFNYAFQNCTNLLNVNFDNLKFINSSYGFGNAFQNCRSLSNISFPSLIEMNHYSYTTSLNKTSNSSSAFYNCFYNCSNLANINFPLLESINMSSVMAYAFYNCQNLSNLEFTSLQYLIGVNTFLNTFVQATNLKHISFPVLKSANENCFANTTLSYVDGCTIHFPANMSSTISTWTNVMNGLGGTNTTILFDYFDINSYFPLSENGNIGSSNFAVVATANISNAYYTLDNNISTAWVVSNGEQPCEYLLYCPNATRIVSMNFQSVTDANYTSPVIDWIQCSNDNNDYVEKNVHYTYDANYTHTRIIDSDYYKYYKIKCRGWDVPDSTIIVNNIDIVGYYK